MSYPPREVLLDQLVEMRKEEANRIWDQASLCWFLVEKYQDKPKDIGAMINCSGRHVQNLVRTWQAFNDEEDRCIELTFTHHRIAAGTEDPKGWLDKAVQEQMSTRQLEQAIKRAKGAKKDDLEPAKRAWAKCEKILEEGGPGAEWLVMQFIQVPAAQVIGQKKSRA